MRTRILWMMFAGLVVCASARADYLEVRHPAHVRSEPRSNSESLFQPPIGSFLILASDQQTNGYYRVEIPGTTEQGFIYRTLVRRFAGNPPGTGTGGQPTDGNPNAGLTKNQCIAKYDGDSTSNCPAAGCGGDPQLNRKKNLTDPAQDNSPQPMTFHQIVHREDQAQEAINESGWKRGDARAIFEGLGEGRAVILKGFLIEADDSGIEACNCYIKGQSNNDFHLDIVAHADHEDDRAIVVEITPRLRPAGWRLPALRQFAAQKKYVRVTGWLMYDTMHPGASSHRATAWEVHPVTKFEVCTGSKASCDQGNNWRDLAQP